MNIKYAYVYVLNKMFLSICQNSINLIKNKVLAIFCRLGIELLFHTETM